MTKIDDIVFEFLDEVYDHSARACVPVHGKFVALAGGEYDAKIVAVRPSNHRYLIEVRPNCPGRLYTSADIRGAPAGRLYRYTPLYPHNPYSDVIYGFKPDRGNPCPMK